MPRKPSQPPVVCEYFAWRLFKRADVIYADGRTGKYDLGKHSLNTRDPQQAMESLRDLDRKKAVELGLAKPPEKTASRVLALVDGWDLYLSHCARNPVMGGVGPSTLKRYRAVRAKHVDFCGKHGISSWQDVNKTSTERYGNWLASHDCSHRSIYLELTLIKSALGWLITEKHLEESQRFKLPLVKPQGTHTYCFTREQVRAMVGRCRGKSLLHWLAEVLVTLACTGMRISELASLR